MSSYFNRRDLMGLAGTMAVAGFFRAALARRKTGRLVGRMVLKGI